MDKKAAQRFVEYIGKHVIFRFTVPENPGLPCRDIALTDIMTIIAVRINDRGKMSVLLTGRNDYCSFDDVELLD